MTISLSAGSRVVFTGDSITDCHCRETDNPLGYGYPLLVAGRWGTTYPERAPRWFNTGVSGNRIADLRQRWTTDVLAYRPDVVSILVGINDTGFRFSFDFDEVTTSQYRADYQELLWPLAAEGVQLVLIEPFLLPVKEEQRTWRDDLDGKIQVVRELAADFGAAVVGADGMFAELARSTEPEHWLPDGVHPSPAGHQALADAWLQQVK